MSYINATDAPEPQFIVVVEHTEYEQSVSLFVTRDAAVKFAQEWLSKGVYTDCVHLGRLEQLQA